MLMQISPILIDKAQKFNLTTLRWIRGYSLTEVSQRVNISVGTLRKYEKRPEETPLSVACELMKLYQCPFSLVQFQSETRIEQRLFVP